MTTVAPVTSIPFTFDEQLHRYTDEHGIILPSVTQVLKDNGFINFDGVPFHILEHKRQLGTLVHKVTELYDQGESLEEFEIPDEIMPYCEGWINFRCDSGFQPTLIEHQIIGEISGMRYGMKLDVEGWLNNEHYIIEKKCGANESPVWGLQTAGYDLGRHGRPTARRAAVQLGPQFPRGYKLFPYTERTDYQIWGAALAQTIWKQNHRLFTAEPIPEREAA